jgi:cytochrome c553
MSMMKSSFAMAALSALSLACALAFAPDLSASALRSDQLVRSAMQLDKNAARGASLFREHCVGCHGPHAHGDAGRLVPSLAGQRQAYIIKQLADFSELERQSTDMHAVVARPALGEPQAWADLAAYLNALPLMRSAQTGDGKGLELGEAMFREQCASCHEEDARGDDEGFVPSLRNQHYSYLLRQMRALAAWHRTNVDPELVRFLDSLEPDEVTSLADYLSRLAGPTRDRLRMHEDGTIGD